VNAREPEAICPPCPRLFVLSVFNQFDAEGAGRKRENEERSKAGMILAIISFQGFSEKSCSLSAPRISRQIRIDWDDTLWHAYLILFYFKTFEKSIIHGG
jgi:hypothetical protein